MYVELNAFVEGNAFIRTDPGLIAQQDWDDNGSKLVK